MATQKNQILLAWQAPEFQHYPKNAAWYITLGIITALIIAFQLFQRDVFGAVCVLIFAVFVVVFSRQHPRTVNVVIASDGLRIDESFIPAKSIRHFWIVDTDNHQTLNIETTAYLNRMLIIQLAGQDPETVRTVMSQLVPERNETQETFAQRIMHRLKF